MHNEQTPPQSAVRLRFSVPDPGSRLGSIQVQGIPTVCVKTHDATASLCVCLHGGLVRDAARLAVGLHRRHGKHSRLISASILFLGIRRDLTDDGMLLPA